MEGSPSRKPLKAGILTLHYGYNEGAVLQAYCLVQLLKTTAGMEAEIVDLRYPAKAAVYGPPSDPRKEAIAHSAIHWLPCSKQHWNSIPGPDFYQELERNYDVLVVGSDVVWTLRYTRTFRKLIPGGVFARQKEPFFPKFPNAYWLPHPLEIPKFSYAASIGSFDWQLAPKRHQRKMKSLLQAFTGISVRDQKTIGLLNHLDPQLANQATLVPDPTLCVPLNQINPNAKEVESKLKSWGLAEDKRKLGLMMGNKEKYLPLIKALKGQEWELVSLTTQNEFSDHSFYQRPLTPRDWARAIGCFDFIVTERMHGMIFCLKNKVPFLALEINPHSKESPSKVVSLLETFDLMDCYCPTTATPEQLLTTLKTAMNRDWDWTKIDAVIEALKQDGERFIHTIPKACH